MNVDPNGPCLKQHFVVDFPAFLWTTEEIRISLNKRDFTACICSRQVSVFEEHILTFKPSVMRYYYKYFLTTN